MAENNFKPFAVGAGANVSSQTDWEKLVALSTGFTAGIARSDQVNKALRQATVVASVLAQFIANKTNSDVLDDGDTDALLIKLVQALNLSGDERFLKTANNLSEISNNGSAAKVSARTNLGLGSAATRNTGTDGDAIPLLSGANVWSATQSMAGSGEVDNGEVRSAADMFYPYGTSGTMWSEFYSSDISEDHFEHRIVVSKSGARKYFRFKESGELSAEGDIKAGGGVYDKGGRVYSPDNKQPPNYIDEIGAYAFAWYDGVVEYNATVSGTALFPSTGDGNHSSSALSGTWRCMGRTETINDQHRTTLWQKIAN